MDTKKVTTKKISTGTHQVMCPRCEKNPLDAAKGMCTSCHDQDKDTWMQNMLAQLEAVQQIMEDL